MKKLKNTDIEYQLKNSNSDFWTVICCEDLFYVGFFHRGIETCSKMYLYLHVFLFSSNQGYNFTCFKDYNKY